MTGTDEWAAEMRAAAVKALTDPADRMGITLTSGLLKLRAKRVIDHGRLGLFETATEASARLVALDIGVNR